MLPSFMRSHGRVAVLTFLLFLFVGIAIGSMSSRGYVASVDLWLDRGRSVDRAVASDSRSAALARNTELRLLSSRDLAVHIVEALGLERVPGFGRRRDGGLIGEDGGQGAAVRAVQERLIVEPIDGSYAVRLRFRADQAVLAAAVANRIADLYVEDRSAAAPNGDDRGRVAAAVADSRDAMMRSEAAVVAYRSAMTIVASGGPSIDAEQDVASVDTELALVRAGAAAVRERAAMETENATARLEELERRQTQRVVEGQASSTAVERQIAVQRHRLDQIDARISGADERVRLVSRMRAQVRRAAVEGERSVAELARLRDVASGARNRHAQAVADLARQTAGRARDRSTAYVITRASTQNVERTPAVWAFVLTSLIVAGASSALVTFVLDYRLKGFKTAAAVERALGMRVLAIVPDLSDLRHPSGPADRLSVPNHLAKMPDSSFADLFRDLLASLWESDGRKGSLVVAVSSALPDEGKTTVALCLARSAAIGGQQTVLIDCDLRRPAASQALFGKISMGLLEVIEDGAELSDALKRDPGSAAMVLGVSDVRRDRVRSLDSRTMAPLIARLRGMFDVVICDCPPALALSEARESAALADSVLLVVRHRVTPTGAVAIAQDMLKRAGAQIAGVALTMVRG